MKKSIIIFVGGGVLGTAAGFALGIFVYPYIFLADKVSELTAKTRREAENRQNSQDLQNQDRTADRLHKSFYTPERGS